MARYSDELISDICMENDIVDVVSQYVQLKKTGRDYSGLCPFHHEKSPSFHVSQEKQLFHCFGCGASGNLVQFVMRTESLDFIEALKVLADRAGIVLPEHTSGADQQLHEKKQRIYKMNKLAGRYFYDMLTKSEEGKSALAYFAGRKISAKTIRTYGLGYAPSVFDGLVQRLRTEGYQEQEIVEAGLASSKDGRVYDRFRERVMFPIIDVRGNVIGFGGRIMGEQVTASGYKLPKYLNTAQTPVFDKGKNLFSLNLAKSAASAQMILAEGYMDVISVYQAGLRNVVATLGTAITLNQAKLIMKYASEILICYDSDEAGQKATLRAIDIINEAGGKSRVMKLKGAKDPDEYIKLNGVEKFKEAIAGSLPSTEFKISLIKSKYDISTTDGKIRFVADTAEALITVPDAVEVDAYIKKVADETEISKEAIYSEYRKRTAKSNTHKIPTRSQYEQQREQLPVGLPQKKQASGGTSPGARQKTEACLLALIAEHKKLYKITKKHLSPEDFSTPIHQRLANRVYESWEKDQKPEAAIILNEFSGNAKEEAQASSVFYHLERYDDDEKALHGFIDKIKLSNIEQEIAATASDAARLNELYQQKRQIENNAWEE